MSDEEERAAHDEIEVAIAKAFGLCYDAHRAARREHLLATTAYLDAAITILEHAHTALQAKE